MEEVAQLCDRVIFLDRGRIAASGHPEELAASAALTRVRLRVTQGLDRLLGHIAATGLASAREDGTVEVELEESHLADFLASLAGAGVRYREIALRKPTLEDYFLKLAGGAGAAAAAGARTPELPERKES
jgi:ABC-2 type transport system ATP-binding protein